MKNVQLLSSLIVCMLILSTATLCAQNTEDIDYTHLYGKWKVEDNDDFLIFQENNIYEEWIEGVDGTPKILRQNKFTIDKQKKRINLISDAGLEVGYWQINALNATTLKMTFLLDHFNITLKKVQKEEPVCNLLGTWEIKQTKDENGNTDTSQKDDSMIGSTWEFKSNNTVHAAGIDGARTMQYKLEGKTLTIDGQSCTITSCNASQLIIVDTQDKTTYTFKKL
ncbi:MAG: hypothetical protein AAF611_03230 [Bacteroidota bacterium]